ncbi:hypothetical protein M409DRAFT_22605 [Zasmidium cellare ATCC 36951]|uniref:F-box domain-containing protein n=1 Tax=Zasmidium cellare ATCC 36951 TaxID=1080233 RepID=A0A6A6CNX2_ZASCE|nr:uncharacterized protein M409DRAFT_22605 [Zasmidium cellare ATCC 36951]KAF2167176.1 hypothetical protein M409DRAFT_22605 [Zasmidium cellare ATCC 36951]
MAKRKCKDNQTSPPSKSTRTTTRTTAHMTTRTTARTTEPVTSARITRSMTTEAARKAVFNTAELLENILVHLPPRQLFTVQRVSHQLKAAIKESTQIQKKMFLRLGGEPEEEWLVRESHAGWRFIPTDSKHATDGSQSRRTVAKANQAIFSDYKMEFNLQGGECLKFNTATRKSMLSLIKVGHHSGAPTYLCDPPCLSAKLIVGIEMRKHHFCHILMEVTSQAGLTLGDLIKDGRLSSAEFLPNGDFTDRPGLERGRTIQECFDQLERKVGAPVKVSGASAMIDGFVIPSEDQRRRVLKRR